MSKDIDPWFTTVAKGYLPPRDAEDLAYVFTRYEAEACGMKGIDYRTAEHCEGESRPEVYAPCLEDGMQMNTAERWLQSPKSFRDRVHNAYSAVSRLASTRLGRNQASVLFRVYGPRTPGCRFDLFDPILAPIVTDASSVEELRVSLARALADQRIEERGNSGGDFALMIRRQANLEVTPQNALETGIAGLSPQDDTETAASFKARKDALSEARSRFVASVSSEAASLLREASTAYLVELAAA